MKLAQHIHERLQRKLVHHCKGMDSARREMGELSEAYYRFIDLAGQLQDHMDRMTIILQMLGLDGATKGLNPEEVSIVKEKFVNPLDSQDLSAHLSTWKAVREYLHEAGESKLGKIQEFLTWLGMKNMTRQRIESALKHHPNTFQVTPRNHERFVALRK